jgi:glycosyltransferase involved in cell wall biosynthesis
MIRTSVIIPTLGRDSLKATLNSILEQGEIVHQIVVVNNGDLEIEFPDNPIIEVIRTTEKFNVSQARNVGLRSVNPESNWIAFCDDDDIWLPGKLKLQIDYCTSRKLHASYTGALVKKSNGQVSIRPTTRYREEKSPLHQVYSKITSRQGYLPFPSFCFESSFLPLASFDERFTEHEDLLFAQDLFMRGCRIGQIPIPLVQINYDLRRSLTRFNTTQEVLWIKKLLTFRVRWSLVYVSRISVLKFALMKSTKENK